MRQYTQTIIEDLCDKGYIPIACVDMQASIYVLHISYEAPDDDPFYELDKFIVKLTQHTSQLDIAYLSNLVGLETSFIRYRFQKLKKDGYLIERAKGCFLTPNAHEYYLSGKRPTKHYDKDVYVNSKTFEFLPSELYKRGIDIIERPNANLSFEPLTATKLASIEKKINRITSEQKNEIMLHADAENIKIEGFTKCGLANFQAAYYMDLNASSMKTSIKQQAYYKGVPFVGYWYIYPDIKSLKLGNDCLYFRKGENKEWNYDEINSFLSDILLQGQTFNKNAILHAEKAIKLYVSKQDILNIEKKSSMMAALNFGYYALPIWDRLSDEIIGDYLLQVIPSDPYVKWLIEINNIAEKIVFSNDIDFESLFPMYENKTREWRKALVEIEKFDILEKIDVSQFITSAL